VQHASFDNSINAGHYIADWVAETLGGLTKGGSSTTHLSTDKETA